MRQFGLLAIFAVCTALFAVGCGGGGGSSNPAVNGIWTGSFTQTRAVGDSSTLQVEFFQSGSTITGTAVKTGVSGSSIGTITGTIDGSQLTASITYLFLPTVIATIPPPSADTAGRAAHVKDAPAQRTEQMHGFGQASWYSTSAPIDLSKPLVVSIDGVPIPTGGYTLDTTTIYTNRIFISTAVLPTSIVQIQYYPVDGTVGEDTVTLTGTVSGSRVTGTYTSTGSAGGNFTLTKSNGATTPNITANTSWWGGTATPTTGGQQSVNFTFTQTKDALTFTGSVITNGHAPGIYVSGIGAVIGKKVTLLAGGGGTTTTFTGVYNGTSITGGTVNSQGVTGIFQLFQAQTTTTQ